MFDARTSGVPQPPIDATGLNRRINLSSGQKFRSFGDACKE